MLWEYLLNAAALIVTTIVGFFPISAGLTADAGGSVAAIGNSAMTSVYGVMMTFDAVIPIHEILGYGLMIFALHGVLYAYIVVRWLRRTLPPPLGSGSG